MDNVPNVTGLLESIERAGGYAALLGLVTLLIFWLAHAQMKEQARRAREREEQAKSDHDSQLVRERQNAEAYKGTTERMIDVVDGNTKAITSLSEIVRPLGPTLARIDRHIGSDIAEGDE